ncbi:MAG TPA: hypothetical protein VLX32_11825 [Candidatus Acidoferrum sp.]|nr:hypothetical protein [Candidatus Acidoferrum sp.]
MTRPHYQPTPRLIENRLWWIIGIFCLPVLVLSGCAEKRSRAFPWATAIQVRPVLASNIPIAALPQDLAPDLRLELPAPPTPLEGPRSEPPRPHTISPATDSDLNRSNRTPLLVPQFTPQELAEAQQETSESLSIAERNLLTVRGRALSALQSDIVSKVSSFIAQSREAAGERDWTRASNLAKKAELLSQELLNSH